MTGAERSASPSRSRANLQHFFASLPSLPFDDSAADVYGKIRAELATRGTPIGPNDLMIAATALSGGLILVTHNTTEFSRVPGLQYEDWQKVDTWDKSSHHSLSDELRLKMGLFFGSVTPKVGAALTLVTCVKVPGLQVPVTWNRLRSSGQCFQSMQQSTDACREIRGA